jgi:shikimate kinase
LQGEDAVARWSALYAARRPLYEQLADVTFDTSSGPLQEVVDALVQWIRTTPTPASADVSTEPGDPS